MRSCLLFCIACLLVISGPASAQNVGIGTNNPDPAAKLEVQSSNSGVLIPRLSTAQLTSIPSPPAGLMVYDNTKNLFCYYDGSQWIDIKPVATNDTIWNSYVSNNERNVYNAIGNHFYIGGLPIKPISDPGTIDGVLRIEHGSPIPLTTNYFLSMDGTTIQARTKNSIVAPMVEAKLLLNRFGGNVGIGLANPSRAKLELNGTGLGTTSAIFGGDGQGISLQRSWPFVGFNQYYDYNGYTGRYIDNGYAAALGVNQTNGNVELQMLGTGNKDAATNSFVYGFNVGQNGHVGMQDIDPDFRLAVNSPDLLYSGIRALGRGYITEVIPDPFPYTRHTHQVAIKAQGLDKAVALEIDGPVSVPAAGSKDFVFNIYPQNSNSSAVGYYTSVGGYWAINLTGTGSPLSDPTFNQTSSYIFVNHYFSWANVPGSFVLPARHMIWYDSSSGEIRYLMDVEPLQTGHPPINLRVMIIRVNPAVLY